jgi:2,3,4,5-tetrahydropyridine-2,6-dicarboxylate N-succinyltransferase
MPNIETLRPFIEDAFERRGTLTNEEINSAVKPAVEQVMSLLESGQARVAEPVANGWQVNEWCCCISVATTCK